MSHSCRCYSVIDRNSDFLASYYRRTSSESTCRGWISGAFAIPATVYMPRSRRHMLQSWSALSLLSILMECKEDCDSLEEVCTNDLKKRPLFNGLYNYLSSVPVLAMVWEGEGVIKYGPKLIEATDPQKSEPGTIRGDLAAVVGRFWFE